MDEKLRKDGVIYMGKHFHWEKEDRLILEKVSLQRYRNKQKEQLYTLKVGKQSRTFTDDELCFFELEELEYRVVTSQSKKKIMCLAPKISEEKLENFLCLTIVIYTVQKGPIPCMYLGSNRIKLFDKVVPGKNCSLTKLETKLKRTFGSSMNQWFMYRVEDNNNEQSVRVVLTDRNFSIMDRESNVLHYHSLHSLNIQDFLINPTVGLINMNIGDDSDTNAANQQTDRINLRYSRRGCDMGYDLRRQLCNNLHEIYFGNLSETGNQTDNCECDDTPDRRLLEWIIDLKDIPIPFYENIPPHHDNPCEESNLEPLSPPTPHGDNARGGSWPKESIGSESQLPVPHGITCSSESSASTPIKCTQKIATEGTWSTTDSSVLLRTDRVVKDVKRPHSSSTTDNESLSESRPGYCDTKLPRNHLLRAESFYELSTMTLQSSSWNDSEESASGCQDDSDYRAIYYKNQGWIKYNVKKVGMQRRIQRQRRLKAQLPDVDFEVVERHENWWDYKYKTNEEDGIFQRLSQRMVSNKPCQNKTDYWNSDLCITVQLMMERKSPRILPDLDLSWPQLLAVIIHLSVDTTVAVLRKDWRDMAELLGLDSRDIEIIQYFCYTQREWPARVVLCHWKLLKDKGRNVPSFSFFSLRLMLQELGREDILKIVNYSDTNCFEVNEENLQSLF